MAISTRAATLKQEMLRALNKELEIARKASSVNAQMMRRRVFKLERRAHHSSMNLKS